MEATKNENLQMEGLLLIAQRELVEAQEVQAGRAARLILTNDEGKVRQFVVPFRVAAYARKVLGAPAIVPEGALRVVFSSRGITVSLAPTTAGYIALADALIARLCGEQRRDKRRVRQNLAKMKRIEAEKVRLNAQKGGAAL